MSRPLRVALVGLIAAGYSGVSRYAASLVTALDDVAGEFGRLQLELLTTAHAASQLRPQTLATHVVRTFGNARGGPRRIAAEQLAAAGARADLLHFFDLSGPLFRPRRPFVTTVHDAGPAYGHQPRRHAYKRFVQPWALRHAAAAVAVSEFARDEAVQKLAGRRERITVIHSGPGMTTARSTTAANGLAPGFLLYVGDLTEHKNLLFLLDVYEEAGVPERLLLVGRPGEGFGRIRARVDALAPARRVEIVEGVDDARLDALYRTAVATLLPSRYEGFGFTPLEAMARDCPVLASDLPALRETAGDGALLLPIDARAPWVDALRRISGNSEVRDDLRERGRRVAERYSWERAARELCVLFERTAAA